MKFFILIFTTLLLLSASEIRFERDFHKALQKAKGQNKEVMMMYSAVWCPECNYMKDVVFKDKKVADYIQKHFIVLTLDIQKDKLPKGFEYIGIPAFFFINKNTKLEDKIIGGDRADRFLLKLKALK